jgi:hypothetical protein
VLADVQSTLRSLRERLGTEMGAWGKVQATASSAAFVEVARSPIKSTSIQSKRYEGFYLFRPDAPSPDDYDRRVKVPGGYDPATGRLTPDNSYTDSVAVDERVELSRLLPGTLLNESINGGLKDCLTVGEFSVVVGQDPVRRVLLSTAAPYLKSANEVLRTGWLTDDEDPTEVSPFDKPFRCNFEQRYGQFYAQSRTLPTDCTLYFEVVQPYFYACRDTDLDAFGDAWGLNSDAASCLVPEDWAVSAALMYAWRKFASVLEPAANARAIRNRLEAADWFSSKSEQYWDRPVPAVRPPLRTWGPQR